jgi:UDP-4-amino-4,6-dideoxy-N-acetyl-beta-L-altrosamine N-acetyltransferase
MTKDIELRLVEEKDLPMLVLWRNSPSIWNYFFNKFPLSIAKQKEWFSELIEDDNRKLFIIITRTKNEPIGTIGLDNIDFANQCLEFGNMLIGKTEFVGKGYAKKATSLLLSYCFNRLNMNRVYLKVYSDNETAVKLYQNCGFKVEGTLRQAHFDSGIFKDVLVMSILRKEFIFGDRKAT